MRIRGRLTTIPDDLPVPDGTQGQIRTIDDDTLIATVETTDGWYTYEQNGNPGPFRILWDYANVISNQYSSVTGPSAATDIANLPLLFRAWPDGVLPDVGNEMAVSATGSTMSVSVGTGAAVVQGILYDQVSASVLDIDTAHATNPRIDTIAVQIVPAGAGVDIEGRSELVVVKGTAAATPAAPALTQTNSLWQHPIADVAVGAGVTAIGSDKVTDRRSIISVEIDNENVFDAIKGNWVAGAGVSVSAGASTVTTTLDTEYVRDLIGDMLVAGSNITLSVNDAGNTVTINSTASGGLTAEQVQDSVASMLVAGSNVTLSYNDATNKLTISSTDTNTIMSTEAVQDIVAAMLTEGTGIDLSYNDATGKITVSSTASGGFTTEQIQDIVGSMMRTGTTTQDYFVQPFYDDSDNKLEFNLVPVFS